MLTLWHLDEVLKRHPFGRMHDLDTQKKQREGYKKLQTTKYCKSLLKKYLSKSAFKICSSRKTFKGATLLDVMRSGIQNLDSQVGVYAPDPDCYSVFSDLFDPIINDYHNCTREIDLQPEMNFGHINSLVDLDPSGEFVLHIRLRCIRNLSGFAFNSLLTEDNYLDIEKKIEDVLKGLDGEFQGTYHSLCAIDRSTEQALSSKNYLFKEGDRYLEAAYAYRHWPAGRGIFHNEAMTFFVWVNEEDHLRIISMQEGGNLRIAYQRLNDAMPIFEDKFHFVRDKRLGYLTFDPTNIGSAIKLSVQIDLPKLAKNQDKMKDIASSFNLQLKRSRRGDKMVEEVSNKSRLGMTEYDTAKELQDGVLHMIQEEKNLSEE